MARDKRLWKEPLASPYIFEGDVSTCTRWIGWATTKLQHMLRNPGARTCTFNPQPDIWIRVDTKPNRIYIKAGTSPAMIHGVISTSGGGFDLSKGFVVYDGTRPDKYLNPIALAAPLVEARTALDWDGNYPNTFLTIKELSKNSYIGFCGHADPYNRIYRRYVIPTITAGLIQFQKKKLLAPLPFISDVVLIGTDLHVLNCGYWSPTAYAMEYLTVSMAGTVTYLKRVRITRTTQKTAPNAQYGFEAYLYDYASATEVLLTAKTHSSMGTPTGGVNTSDPTNPGVYIQDAKFSPDNTRICFLLALRELKWDMTPPPAGTESSTNQFQSIFDLVIFRTSPALSTAVEVSDPYTGCTIADPIVGRFYPLEHMTVKTHRSMTVTAHSDLLTAKTDGFTYGYYWGVKTYQYVFGPVYVGANDGAVTLTNGELDANQLFNPIYVDPSVPNANAVWDADATVAWENTPDVDPTVVTFYALEGTASRNITVYLDYGLPTQETYHFTITRKIYRTALLAKQFTASGTLSFEFSGTHKFQYIFDKSTGARDFLELGYKVESSGNLNRVAYLRTNYSINTSQTSAATVYDPLTNYTVPTYTVYMKIFKIEQTSTYSAETTQGGAVAQTIYHGTTPIQRFNYVRSLQQGAKNSITYSSTYTCDGFGPVTTTADIDRSYTETNTCKPFSQVSVNDYNPDTAPTAKYALGNAVIVSGSVFPEYGTGQYSTYAASKLYPYNGQYIDPLTSPSYAKHIHIEYPYYTKVDLHAQCSVINGVDYNINATKYQETYSSAISYNADITNNHLSGSALVTVAATPTMPVTPNVYYVSFWLPVMNIPERGGKYTDGGIDYFGQIADYPAYDYSVESFDAMGINYAFSSTLPYPTSKDVAASKYVASYQFFGALLNSTARTSAPKAGVSVLSTGGVVLADNRSFPDGTVPDTEAPTSINWRTVLGYKVD